MREGDKKEREEREAEKKWREEIEGEKVLELILSEIKLKEELRVSEIT